MSLNRLRNFVLSLVLFVSPLAFALSPEFQDALSLYQKKQYAEAAAAFQKLANEPAPSAALLHNYALTEYRLDHKPMALALWRKALATEPGFRPAREGRAFVEAELQARPLDLSLPGLDRSLEYVSFWHALWVNAVLLALAGLGWVRYWAARKTALEEEAPRPAFPTWAAVALAFWILSLGFASLKAQIEFQPRATITGNVSALSLPADDGVSLFDLRGGAEVKVRSHQSGWTQVQNADGASGWIKDTSLLVTTGS